MKFCKFQGGRCGCSSPLGNRLHCGYRLGAAEREFRARRGSRPGQVAGSLRPPFCRRWSTSWTPTRSRPFITRFQSRTFERLLGQKAIVAPDNATGAGDYRFASADAAEKWFAAARPIVPPAGAKSPLQKLDFGFPISTGARVSFDAAGRPWFWERWSMPADQFKREVEEIAAGKQGLIPGEILLIDRDDRAWMVRSPSAANHICQPTKTKVSPDSR